MAKTKRPPLELKVEYTEGYQQRFTLAILKIYENRIKEGRLELPEWSEGGNNYEKRIES